MFKKKNKQDETFDVASVEPIAETDNTDGGNKKSKTKKRWTLILAVNIVVILGIVLTGLYLYNDFKKDKSGEILETAVKAELGQLDGKNKEQIEAELNRVIDEGTMQISINLNPTFPAGDAEGILQIENSPANLYAQEVTITLDETGEVIYRSGLLLPNYHIETDKLLVDLDKGEYDCTAVFTGYDLELSEDPDNLVKVGTAASKIRIFVLS